MASELVTVGSRIPLDSYYKLRWLAYMKGSTVSEVVAGYIAAGIGAEDFSRYQPPDQGR